MDAKSPGRLDRRTVVGAVAGLACAGAAQAGPEGTQVIVDLGGVALPDAIARVMELEIRRAVLMAVARARPHTKFKSLTLPKDALGIILRPA